MKVYDIRPFTEKADPSDNWIKLIPLPSGKLPDVKAGDEGSNGRFDVFRSLVRGVLEPGDMNALLFAVKYDRVRVVAHDAPDRRLLYHVTAVLPLADGLAVIRYDQQDQLWARSTAGSRKRHNCAGCWREIPIGENAYRPVNQGLQYRGRRCCLACVDGVEL